MRSTPSRIAAALVTLALGTGGAPPATALTAQHRLERAVIPTAEALRLELDAAKSGYTGTARIDLAVAAATDSFQFQAQDLELERMTLRGAGGPAPLTWRAGPHGIVTARAAKPLTPGTWTLEIAFANEFNTRGVGLYKLKADGESYIVSQFESISARQAFPCWDEPEFKIPWQITVVVPRAHLAISNTPPRRDSLAGETRVVEFERTPPLPSYLVAILAGPWETVPIPGMSVPGRVVTPKGSSGLAASAARETPKILAALEGYFGSPYPYRKLDLIAVPEFWAGAMENAGAVTFRDRVLLLDPRGSGPQERKTFITYTAHELAHMWFGDLVTLRWWDDVWLNESFASWLGDKVSQQVAPEFDMPVDELEGTQRAMERDAQRSTRAMRARIDGFDDIDEGFDELAYQKGQAVLGMLEQWLGPDTFRKGVRDYIQAHAWGNAEGADFWNALSKASGQDVSKTVTSFLDQPGVPMVSAIVGEGRAVHFTQGQFYNVTSAPKVESKWLTPVAFRYSDGTTAHTRTILLGDREQIVKLDDVARVDWILPNAEARGYYRWYVARDMNWTLVDRATTIMSPRERVGLVHNTSAGIEAGTIPIDEALQMFGRMCADPRPEVTNAVLDGLDRVRLTLITPDLEPAFATYVRKYLGPALARIGAAPAPGEGPPTSLLRPRLMTWVGRYGHDAKVVARAREQADAWMRDPGTLAPSLVQAALGLAAMNGDAARFAEYQRRFEQARTPVDRVRFLGALGSFSDSALVERALDYTLTDAVRPTDMYILWRSVNGEVVNQERTFAWMTRNYDALARRLPPETLPYLVRFADGCSPERLEAARAFFTPARRGPGYEIEEARVADAVAECAALRHGQTNTLRNYLDTISAAK
ncbi:MAG TPA: M1 family metallopeptidase [Candidatus Eisenbacteria bacterium]